MSSIITQGSASGTGSMTLAAPVTNSTQTITLPDASGICMVSGNMPAFSAYLANNQSTSSGVYTKITINTEEFDTANAFDSTTNYRFTPQVAGYYQVNASVGQGNSAITQLIASIYKNGSNFKVGNNHNSSTIQTALVSCLIYLNGSTDYIEFYSFNTGTAPVFLGGSNTTYFQASMVRAA